MDDIHSSPEPANLRFLRRLVTALTATMIFGLLTVIVLLVIRLRPLDITLPEEITLPDGTTPVAFTRAQDWMAVVTQEEILIFDLDGTIRQTVRID